MPRAQAVATPRTDSTPTTWDEAWDQFLRQANHKLVTRRNYQIYAKRWDVFRAQHQIVHPDQWTDKLELDFLDTIAGAESTRWTYHRTLRAFLNFCIERGFRQTPSKNKVSEVPATQLPINDLNWQQLQDALRLASPRDRMIIELGVITGMRAAELRNFKLDYWHRIDREIFWPETKTDDYRVISIPQEVNRHMIEYVRTVRPKTSEPWFFVTQRRGRTGDYGQMTKSCINSAFGRLRDELGWKPRTFTPQTLRRTFANVMLEETGDVSKVMRIGGWKDQRSLHRYLAKHAERDPQVMEGAWERMKGEKT